VEGSRLDARRTQLLQSTAQLAGRAGRERHCKHGHRVVCAGGDAVSDAVGDRPGLARAGSGNDCDWPAESSGDLTLLRVEIIQ
jgi:hypothetical protein